MSISLHLSLHEYNRMVDRGAFNELNRKIELIRGELVEMNPAGPVHDDYIEYLMDWSFRSTDRTRIRVRGQTGINIVESDSRPEPDVFWVNSKRYLTSHPTGKDTLLVIEVSDSSLESDLSTKSAIYAVAAIQEYWVVDVCNRCIHVMREPDGHGIYRLKWAVWRGEILSPIAQPDASLDISDLFGVDRH